MTTEGVRRRLTLTAAEARRRRLRKLGEGAKQECQQFAGCLAPYAMQALAASMGYSAALFVVQSSGHACGISCVSSAAPFVGAIGVGAASVLAGRCSEAYKLYPQHGIRAIAQSWKNVARTDILVDAFIGIVACKLLGGRFRTVLPSDVRYPGAFADRSIVVRRAKADANQRQENRLNFKKAGCHHCGTRFGEIIADHQPPNKQYAAMRKSAEAFESFSDRLGFGKYARMAVGFLGESMPPQRLFPQCRSCMQLQATSVRNDKKILVMHWGVLQPFHWAAGMIVGAQYYERKKRR